MPGLARKSVRMILTFVIRLARNKNPGICLDSSVDRALCVVEGWEFESLKKSGEHHKQRSAVRIRLLAQVAREGEINQRLIF